MGGRVVVALVVSGWLLVPLWPAASLITALLACAAALWGRWSLSLQAALAAVVVSAAGLVPVARDTWPVPLLVGLLVAACVARITPWVSVPWWRGGRVRAAELGLAAALSGVAAVALIVWWRWMQPDLHDVVARIPQVHWLGLVAVGLLFAVTNALVEESLFRGILTEALTEEARLSLPGATVAQAVVFGVLHLHGFPRGALGVVLAGIYGLMMGVIRARSGGLWAAWISHVAVDLVIFSVVAALALGLA